MKTTVEKSLILGSFSSIGFFMEFVITNSTAFDQYFVNGRNIFENISRIVDNIFNMFIRRVGRREPFFASYCNGTTSTCAGLSQWGSQDLALRGYTYMQILKYYFPSDIQIVESTNFTTQTGVYAGVPLREGSSGSDVRLMQDYLNRISGNFYIPIIPEPNGFFGAATKSTTIAFQGINNLIPDGIIGKSTWYQIIKVYVAVRELAELTSEGERIGIGLTPPTVVIQLNSRGEYVVELQFILNFISAFFPSIPSVIQDGVFRDATKRSVTEFQKEFGLTPDGIVGPATWQRLYDVYHSIIEVEPDIPTSPTFPGYSLQLGSTGDNVRIMQEYLNAIGRVYTSIPAITADGVFGPMTQQAVRAFQAQFGLTVDGIIGRNTWDKIVYTYNNLGPAQRPPYPGVALRIGSTGNNVRIMQSYLNAIAYIFPAIPTLSVDGNFGANTQRSVIAFQKLFNLSADGIIGRNTWDKIVDVYFNLPELAVPQYPGVALRVGSRGNDVLIMQKYLNNIARRFPSIPTVSADGIFGANTENAVKAFQRQFGLTADGVIGVNTWNQIVTQNNLIGMPLLLSQSDASVSAAPQNNTINPFILMALSLMMQ